MREKHNKEPLQGSVCSWDLLLRRLFQAETKPNGMIDCSILYVLYLRNELSGSNNNIQLHINDQLIYTLRYRWFCEKLEINYSVINHSRIAGICLRKLYSHIKSSLIEWKTSMNGGTCGSSDARLESLTEHLPTTAEGERQKYVL